MLSERPPAGAANISGKEDGRMALDGGSGGDEGS
jgi:hypothetical protein